VFEYLTHTLYYTHNADASTQDTNEKAGKSRDLAPRTRTEVSI